MAAHPHWRLYDLAENLGVERHTIESAVKSITGLSFRDFSKKERLEIALHLLIKEGQKSEKDIAYHLGYHSTRAFGRFIKTNTGKTPSEIRNGNRKARNIASVEK